MKWEGLALALALWLVPDVVYAEGVDATIVNYRASQPSLSEQSLGQMWITGYALRGTTADGVPVQSGVAACPPRFAFGTTLDIDGLGTVVCHDRGLLRDDQIDVWFPSVVECYQATGWRGVRIDA